MKALTLIGFFCIVLSSWAQQYNFRTYSVEQGLPRSSTYALFQDSDGFIWTGLEGGGVAMFDGYKFRSMDMTDGLPSQNVRAIYKDSKGVMWFGTMEGLCRYDFKSLRVYTVEDGLVDNYVRTITEDNFGVLWIGTNNGISLLEGETFTNLNAPNDILHKKIRIIQKDVNGKIWVGSNDGINIFQRRQKTFEGSKILLVGSTVLELFEDDSKSMWVGSKNGAYKMTRKDTLYYSDKEGLISNRVRAISQDQYGNMWFGTREGLSRFDNKKFVDFTEKNGLSHNRIRDIIRDQQGNLWFATYFGGLSTFSGSDFVHFTTEEGLVNDQIFSIYEDQKGDIILGSFDGITKLKFKNNRLDTVKNVIAKDGLSGERVNDIYKDTEGYYWYGTDFGITLMKGEKHWTISPADGLPGEEILVIKELSKNDFWVGTSKGICHITFRSPTDYDIETFPEILDLYKGSDVTSIIKDYDNNIWFGYRNGELLCKRNTGDFIQPEIDKTLTNIINITYSENNQLWVGTDALGLYRIDLTNLDFSQAFQAQFYSIKDGLSSNHIYSFLFDQENYAWIGSEKGLDRVRFNSNYDVAQVKHYGVKDGLFGLEVHENATFEDKDGDIWFGTVKGAAYYNTNLDRKNSVRPKLHFTGISIKDLDIDDNDRVGRFRLPPQMTLDYHQNNIEFSFVGINTSSPKGTTYKWMLEGFDKEFSNPSSRQSIFYTNLPPGEYTFKVMAANENGLWTITAISYTFTIKAPFWETWWFIVLMVFLSLGVLFGLAYIRTRKLQKAKSVLEGKIDLATQALREEKEIIEVKNAEIEIHRDKLTETNLAITDSINYAQRIQKAIMRPSLKKTNDILNKMFVYYVPKDIVSGDFYWVSEKAHCSYIVAADCTGHGVPGAFMSMIGISYLNQIVNSNDIESPENILDALRINVIEALRTDKVDKAKDGMDMSCVRIDWKSKTLHYAGANNPIYIIRDNELTILSPDKMPVGDHDLKDQNFTLHELNLHDGDMIYMFSDGYADQFGGNAERYPLGKKFLYKRFKALLIEVSNLALDDQKEKLNLEFNKWRGDFEQIDDLLVLGIKI